MRNVAMPHPTVVIADTTFWGRHYGVTVFRAPGLKKNLWWQDVVRETVETYRGGRRSLEREGWTFTAAVVDGRRGLASVFGDIPVQVCQFHQVKTATKYLTRRPETLAGQELRLMALGLSQTTEADFTKSLDEWHGRWREFIAEKTYLFPGSKHWTYTHRRVRGAYRSLVANLPHLFTYQKYPDLHIPNTTNSLDGMFSQLKNRLAVHRGVRGARRYKLISEILTGEEK